MLFMSEEKIAWNEDVSIHCDLLIRDLFLVHFGTCFRKRKTGQVKPSCGWTRKMELYTHVSYRENKKLVGILC